MGRTLSIQSDDGFCFDAYLAQPTGEPKASLVVLQEIFGLNDHIKSVADFFASEGYLVIAPATQDRSAKNLALGYAPEDMAEGIKHKTAVTSLPNNPVMSDIQASIYHVANTKKVGVIGYCWGGFLAWKSACELQGVSAAISYYPGGIETADDLTPQCPTMLHFATEDKHITLDIVENFKNKQTHSEVFIYQGQHGFNCDARSAYHADAAKLALQRSLDFLKKNLL